MINFYQQSPKMLKTASESFIHALLLFLGLFLKIFLRVPLYIFFPHQHTWRQCKKSESSIYLNHKIH